MNKFKYFLYLGVICSTLFLTGCGNNNKELSKKEILCQKILPYVEKYYNNQITYDQFLKDIKSDYNDYCPDDDNTLCQSLYAMYFSENVNTELEDCSKYNDDSLGQSMKKICEATNAVKEEIIAKKDQTQNAYVRDLEHTCKN